MTPDNIVAALGFFCGSGSIEVRHGEDWTKIHTTLDTWDQPVVSTADLFLILTAEEAR